MSQAERNIGPVHTLSALAGTRACDARCPYCVAKMTPSHNLELIEPPIRWDRFRFAFDYARAGNSNTFMVTGKGEPWLFPKHVIAFLAAAQTYENETGFRFVKKEIQSNGIKVAQQPEKYDTYLSTAVKLGLQTMIISIVHYDPEINKQIFIPYEKQYIDLKKTRCQSSRP